MIAVGARSQDLGARNYWRLPGRWTYFRNLPNNPPDTGRVLARYVTLRRLLPTARSSRELDGSALRRRYKKALQKAELRPLRFHDLRHTFGSIAINQATIAQVQAWMGHADIQTTMKYMHHRSRAGEARLLSAAFRPKKKRPSRRKAAAAK